MTRNLVRFQASRQTHFVTFSCYHRLPNLRDSRLREELLATLESERKRCGVRVYGFVVMPEHAHLLVSEPESGTLADFIRSVKVSTAKRAHMFATGLGENGSFWQQRYYDHNIRSYPEFVEKLKYIHRNPVKRGLCLNPAQWQWSSFRHYAMGKSCLVEIESEWTAKQRTLQTEDRTPG